MDEATVVMLGVVWTKDGIAIVGEEAVLGSPIEFLLIGTKAVLWLLEVSASRVEVVMTGSASSWEEMERSMMASTGALMVVAVEVLWSLMIILGTLGCSYWYLTSLGLGGWEDQSETSTVGVSGGVGGMNSELDSRALSSGVAG